MYIFISIKDNKHLKRGAKNHEKLCEISSQIISFKMGDTTNI